MGQFQVKVDQLSGGVTNQNYVVTTEKQKLVIRVAGKGTGNYIDRMAEYHNAAKMSELGIAPAIYYSQPDNGFMVSEFLEGKTMTGELFQDNPKLLQAAAWTLSTCHTSGTVFDNIFSPEKKILDNLGILKQHSKLDYYAEWDNIVDFFYKTAESILDFHKSLSPCHNDTIAGNFLGSEDKLCLIDWEYSGMNDAYYDLACFSMESELSQEQEAYFLEYYCKCSNQQLDYKRFFRNKFLAALYWSSWSLLQIAYGKNAEFYFEYGKKRMEAAKIAQVQLLSM